MTQAIEKFFSSIFGSNVILATILIAMVPIIELKGALPFSMSVSIWGQNSLDIGQAFLFSVLGSSIVIPILLLLYIPIINFFKKTKIFKKIAIRIEEKINSKKQGVDNKIEQIEQTKQDKPIQKNRKIFLIKLLSVFLFVAIPLPFTGVYTGSCLAVALGLGFWWGVLVVFVGNLVAGTIMAFLSSLFPSTMTLVYIFLGLILIFAIIYFIRKIIIKNRNNNIAWFFCTWCDILF